MISMTVFFLFLLLFQITLTAATLNIDYSNQIILSSPSRVIIDGDADASGNIWVLFNDSTISKYNQDFQLLQDYPNPTGKQVIRMEMHHSNATEYVLIL